MEMTYKLFEVQNQKIAEISSEEIVITNRRDVLDIMANANYEGAESVVLYETNLGPEFFELQTGMAGEIMQQFANYRMKLAIIGEFEKVQSKSLSALIRECNRGDQVFFVPDRETAISRIVR